ncbi:MAG: glutamine--fructose-6-phosphate transaminase (isomerizing) [Candidatus Andersenbacteria bacterium]
MCGVVGLVPAKPFASLELERELADSLGLLLYRGYDSVGAAQSSAGGIVVTKLKAAGVTDPHVVLLERLQAERTASSAPTLAIVGHSRWATHGPATDTNAHPHRDCSGQIALVHNGIVENLDELRTWLAEQGCAGPGHYASDTDTEVVAHLVGHFRVRKQLPFREAVEAALEKVRGSYAFVLLDEKTPGTLIAARLGSPLLLGVRPAKNGGGRQVHDVAIVSSAEPLANHGYTQVRALEDGDLVEISPGAYPETVRFYRATTPVPPPSLDLLDVKASYVDKGGCGTFFEKEIKEQPAVARTVLAGHYVDETAEARLGGFARWSIDELRAIERVWLIAEGTSLHAAEIGAEWLRRYAGLDATTKLASEFALNPGRVDPARNLYIFLSQSGETADVRLAAEEVVRQNGKIFGLVNVVGSSIARLVGKHGGGMHTHAGPEISVASSKVYTAQLSQLAIVTLFFARNVRGVMPRLEAEQWIAAHRRIPEQLEETLKLWEQVGTWAEIFAAAERGVLFIGRGPNLATAREGALKLRELSYINAVGYSAGEMKHGTIALIDEHFPTVAVAPRDTYYEKMLGNMHEVNARGGKLFAVVTRGDKEAIALADKFVEVPATHEAFSPILAVVPLQILTHEVASLRGTPIDKPRNLAKSVTVT